MARAVLACGAEVSMITTRATIAMGLATTLCALVALDDDARACGGCFAPTENPTVVTDHRMILSVTKTQSTLYDQITYQGEPTSFAWVLPFSGEITVGLSADVVFSALDQVTTTSILPPPGCVQNNFGGSSGGSSASSSGSAGAAAPAPEVTVLKHEVVGPYDTVQLQASDPKALETWLQNNGFAIPPAVAPVVDQYVTEKFNFLALKLVPNKGVQDMRPVRVTTQGANVALPLRMVAAGTGATVGISLWVIGEGRYEPQNFASFIINNNDLGWDRTANKSNYTDVRAQLEAKSGGAAWEVESSIFLIQNQVENIVRQGTYTGGGPYPQTDEDRAATDYAAIKDANGIVTKTAAAVRDEDLTTLFSNLPTTRVTRMRADLAHAALGHDLTLRASADQSFLTNVRQLTRCGLPDDPTSTIINPGDPTSTTTPTSSASPPPSSTKTFTCAAGPAREDPTLSIGLGVAAVVIARVIRRRRSR
jgi:hypothetical protein